MNRYLALSDRATGPQSTGVRDVTHLIWPESAFPFFLTREADALAQIAKLLPEGTVLITGAVRAPEDATGPRSRAPTIRSIVIDHDGSILSVYDKVHLVPFGEYLPFQDFLERLGLMQLTKVRGGFIPGDRRRPVAVPGAPQLSAAGLLRDHLSGRGGAARRASGLDAQPHQRRLVRRQPRSLPALPAGARARHRGRTAAGARRQYRDFGGRRSGRPRDRDHCRSAPKACSTRVCRARFRRRLMHGWAMVRPACLSRSPWSWCFVGGRVRHRVESGQSLCARMPRSLRHLGLCGIQLYGERPGADFVTIGRANG